MLFIKTCDLKMGMRLAKPIYNRNGVLLYERNTKLTSQSVESVKNFGLIGLYILEPAEPVPPMSDEEIEFERFQTMSVFSIRDDMNFILRGRAPKNMFPLMTNVLKNYGDMHHRLHFEQNLRSSEDYIYKHAVNMAILVALMSNKVKLSYLEQSDVIMAALLHDIGKLNLPYEIKTRFGDYKEEDIPVVKKCQLEGAKLIKPEYNLSPGCIRLIDQMHKCEFDGYDPKYKTNKTLQIMLVAEQFDRMTAMSLTKEPVSELNAVRVLLEEHIYSDFAVGALIDSLDILYPGVCIELSSNEKALVIRENESDVLRPVVLGFQSNNIYDLSLNSVYDSVKIRDIMKTMDNRIKVDKERLREYGLKI